MCVCVCVCVRVCESIYAQTVKLAYVCLLLNHCSIVPLLCNSGTSFYDVDIGPAGSTYFRYRYRKRVRI